MPPPVERQEGSPRSFRPACLASRQRAAGSARGGVIPDRSSRPAHTGRCAPQPSPYPPDLSWWAVEGALTAGSSTYAIPSSLSRPAPSGSTSTSRRWRGRFPSSPASPESGCPQLHPPATTTRRCRSFTRTRSCSASDPDTTRPAREANPATAEHRCHPRGSPATPPGRRSWHQLTDAPRVPARLRWGHDA